MVVFAYLIQIRNKNKTDKKFDDTTRKTNLKKKLNIVVVFMSLTLELYKKFSRKYL